MSQSIKLITLLTLIFSANLAADGVHLVITHDTKGDTAGCVSLNKQYNELALKLVPKNHPTVRMIQASYAGSESGLLWLVVEFDDLADLARVTAALEANKEAMALQDKIYKQCPVVSTSLGNQLYYRKGTK